MVHTAVIELPTPESALALAGEQEENLKLITQQMGAKAVLRGQALHLSGTQSQIDRTQALIQSLGQIWGQGRLLTPVDIMTARHALDTQRQGELQDMQKDVLA
ncbi:MAG: phosphate starvation-inducible protein PhoH, partial [Prochlorothrix sp.]